MLRRVETDPDWGTFSPLSPGEYEGYFYQVRSNLPGLDKKVITSVAVRRSCKLVTARERRGTVNILSKIPSDCA